MKIKILGVTLETELEELTNPDVAKKYEDGIEKAIAEIQQSMDCEVGSEGVRTQCNAVINVFIDMFGEEATKTVLGEKTNLFRCLDAFDELVSLYPKQVTPTLEKRIEKYSRSRLNGR